MSELSQSPNQKSPKLETQLSLEDLKPSPAGQKTSPSLIKDPEEDQIGDFKPLRHQMQGNFNFGYHGNQRTPVNDQFENKMAFSNQRGMNNAVLSRIVANSLMGSCQGKERGADLVGPRQSYAPSMAPGGVTGGSGHTEPAKCCPPSQVPRKMAQSPPPVSQNVPRSQNVKCSFGSGPGQDEFGKVTVNDGTFGQNYQFRPPMPFPPASTPVVRAAKTSPATKNVSPPAFQGPRAPTRASSATAGSNFYNCTQSLANVNSPTAVSPPGGGQKSYYYSQQQGRAEEGSTGAYYYDGAYPVAYQGGASYQNNADHRFQSQHQVSGAAVSNSSSYQQQQQFQQHNNNWHLTQHAQSASYQGGYQQGYYWGNNNNSSYYSTDQGAAAGYFDQSSTECTYPVANGYQTTQQQSFMAHGTSSTGAAAGYHQGAQQHCYSEATANCDTGSDYNFLSNLTQDFPTQDFYQIS
jgi:hypothetical protein